MAFPALPRASAACVTAGMNQTYIKRRHELVYGPRDETYIKRRHELVYAGRTSSARPTWIPSCFARSALTEPSLARNIETSLSPAIRERSINRRHVYSIRERSINRRHVYTKQMASNTYRGIAEQPHPSRPAAAPSAAGTRLHPKLHPVCCLQNSSF